MKHEVKMEWDRIEAVVFCKKAIVREPLFMPYMESTENLTTEINPTTLKFGLTNLPNRFLEMLFKKRKWKSLSLALRYSSQFPRTLKFAEQLVCTVKSLHTKHLELFI